MQMNVLLTQDVMPLGKAGEVKRVARGYARNFLMPRGLAVVATDSAVKQSESYRKAQTKRDQKVVLEAQAFAARINAVVLEFSAKVGEQERLYGSITSADIAEKLEQMVGEGIDRRKIELPEAIRELGEHRVAYHVAGEVVAHFTVKVSAEA